MVLSYCKTCLMDWTCPLFSHSLGGCFGCLSCVGRDFIGEGTGDPWGTCPQKFTTPSRSADPACVHIILISTWCPSTNQPCVMVTQTLLYQSHLHRGHSTSQIWSHACCFYILEASNSVIVPLKTQSLVLATSSSLRVRRNANKYDMVRCSFRWPVSVTYPMKYVFQYDRIEKCKLNNQKQIKMLWPCPHI